MKCVISAENNLNKIITINLLFTMFKNAYIKSDGSFPPKKIPANPPAPSLGCVNSNLACYFGLIVCKLF